tara:strand:- start:815 stop:1081 length:267 start_codon:yes stop_codon:yes gene_type:complete
MNIVFPVLIMCLFGISVWYIITPLFEGSNNIPIQMNKSELMRYKLVLMRRIKELEMDYHIENISDKDYQSERKILKKEISLILEKLKY